MDDDQRLKSIEKKLDAHGDTLGDIQQTLNLLAVQNERIVAIQKQLANLWRKYDELASPNGGMLTDIKSFQASCPRKNMSAQIKWLWFSVIPLSFTLIAIGVRLLK